MKTEEQCKNLVLYGEINPSKEKIEEAENIELVGLEAILGKDSTSTFEEVK